MTQTTVTQLEDWLMRPEGTTLEFKEARNSFNSKNDLPDYCAALANEGGGKLLSGVNNAGKVVGTHAFQGTVDKVSHELYTKIKIRVDIEEIEHPDGRVLVFHVPGRLQGQRIKSTGRYLYPMRMGESLAEMDDMKTKEILNEPQTDFSATIVDGLIIQDINHEAVNRFKEKWAQKAKRNEYARFSTENVLQSIRVLSDKGLNYAALILFGKKEKLDMALPDSEIIFEWRCDATKTAHDFRKTWRESFFTICDDIWETINARNMRQPFQEGLFQREIYSFNEKAIREALLNAVAHRDYTVRGRSIFIKASPQEFFIESPGGFPQGITVDNILDKTYWRNRLIAEILEKAEMIERAGQGMNDIFEISIREGKGLPNFSGTDDFTVALRIPAQIKDKNFILFLEKVAKEKQILLSFDEIFALEKIREKEYVTHTDFRDRFLKLGIIEHVGRTRGSQYILSHKYYSHAHLTGLYTRLTGLSREQKKELITNHLKKNKKGYMKDFKDAFKELKTMDISNLLQELKREGVIIPKGNRRNAFWVLANK